VADRPVLSFELRAGLLEDTDTPLPVIERIRPIVGGTLAWSATFGPSGAELVYSSWRDGEPRQALRVLPLGSSGAPVSASRLVIEDGRDFTLAADGRTVYFQRGGTPDRGDLWAADFPSGEAVMEIAKGVHDYSLLGRATGKDEGLLFVTEMRGLEGVLQVMRDRKQPRDTKVLSRDAHFWYPSPDGKFTYILEVTRREEHGSIADNTTGGICRLGSHPEARVYNPTFLSRQGSLFWTEEDPVDHDATLSFFGRPEDCGDVRPLGPGLEEVLPIGGFLQGGLMYVGRVGTSASPGAAALYHVPAPEPGRLLGQGTLILEGIDLENMIPLRAPGEAPDLRALVVGTTKDAPRGLGLHVFGPFAPSPAR
jgi:hypothetical protein